MIGQLPEQAWKWNRALPPEMSETSASSQLRTADTRKARRWVRRKPARAVVLVVGDLLVVNMMLFITQLAWAKLEPLRESLWEHPYYFATVSILWLAVGGILGTYDLAKAFSVSDSLKATLSTAVIVSFLNLLIPVLTPSMPSRRLEGVEFLLLMVGGTALWRFIFARAFVHPGFHRRALIIGAGWAGSTLAEAMSQCGARRGNFYNGKGYELIGFIDDDAMKKDKVIGGLPVLGTNEELVHLVQTLQPDDLILAITHKSSLKPEMFQAILNCRELWVSVLSMHTLYERMTHQVPLEHSGNNLDVIMPLAPSIGKRLYCIFREAADIVTAIPGVALLAVMVPMVWAANRVSSPGPVLYRQERTGKSGKVFMILKFRSMVVDAERQTGGVWAKDNDDRVTPVGRLLRRSRLDELPQVWNVLKGEMSLIGPRPERPCFVEVLEKEIPFYRLRHAVKPGVTGWSQVQFRYAASVNDSLAKLRYDFYYIKNQSVFLDLLILVKTFRVMFGFRGR